MSIERVRAYLGARGMEDRIREFPVSSATVELAAQALGVEPARIAKTLSFKLGERVILIVAAGDARVDNPRYKAEFGGKAKMLTPQEAEELVGHRVGGVCPFAVNPGVEIRLDQSLRRFDVIYPAAGSANSAVVLNCQELEELTGGTWVDVCKGWQEETV